MSEYLVNSEDLTTVANAIRSKGGTSAQLSFPNGMATAIANIQTGITPTGSYGTITPSTSAQNNINVTNYATINVGAIPNQKSDSGNVTLTASTTSKSYAAGYYPNAHGAQVSLQSKTATYTTNGTYTISPDSGKLLSSASVTVNATAALSANMHNFSTDTVGAYIDKDNGTVIEYSGWTATDYIEVDNTSYYFFSNDIIWYACYDANKNFVSFAVARYVKFSDTRIKYFRASFSDGVMANFNMVKLICGTVVPSTPEQSKTASYTANGTYSVYPDSGKTLGGVTVTVAIPQYSGWW